MASRVFSFLPLRPLILSFSAHLLDRVRKRLVVLAEDGLGRGGGDHLGGARRSGSRGGDPATGSGGGGGGRRRRRKELLPPENVRSAGRDDDADDSAAAATTTAAQRRRERGRRAARGCEKKMEGETVSESVCRCFAVFCEKKKEAKASFSRPRRSKNGRTI